MTNIDTLIEEIKGRHICRPRNQAERDRNFMLVDLETAIKQMLDGYALVHEVDIKLLLSFAPSGEVPKGLDPTFYHTLTYDGDHKLQQRIDEIKAMITAQGEE